MIQFLNKATEEEFNQAFFENFTVQDYLGNNIDLIPNGSSISVNYCDRKEYLDLLINYRLNEFDHQIQEIKKGLV